MRVLFVTPECFPLIKTGGLADVAGALPLALVDLGLDARVLLPGYPSVLRALGERETVAPLPDLFGGDGRLLRGRADTGLSALVIDAPHLYDRPGNPYLGADGKDWPDNHFRFAALSRVGAGIALGELGAWRPDVANAHDWQAGLMPAYLAFSDSPRPPTVLTIHNLAFQGLFPASLLAPLGLPRSSFTTDGLEFYGRIGFLKAGLRYADHLTTVSATYAREIRLPEAGMGLDGLLRHRAGVLTGICNGIDDRVWDPATDRHIAAGYSVKRLAAKRRNKSALQAQFGLDEGADGPLFGVVSRLTAQKGLDLLLDALPAVIARGGQLALLGSGDAALETAYAAAAKAYPGRVGVTIGYDEALSHLIQAGADAIVVPSRFEPCGLTQLCGLRYGTLPVVARVGGLADTVIDANDAAIQDGVATGFQFSPLTAAALGMALDRAIDLYADTRRWRAVQRRAMTRTVDWSLPARGYARLYESLLSGGEREGLG